MTGNAGGNSGVAIGQAAQAAQGNAGNTGPVAIGRNAVAVNESVVIGANASCNISSVTGNASVVIGPGATSNKAAGFNVAIGNVANVTQTSAIAIGSGASATAAAGQTRSIVIGAGSSSTATDAIVIGGGSALTTKSIALGAGAVDLGAEFLQLGAAGTPISTASFFTNASGADNSAGDTFVILPLGTGAGIPSYGHVQAGRAEATGSALQTASDILSFGDSAGTDVIVLGSAFAGTLDRDTFGAIGSDNIAPAAPRATEFDIIAPHSAGNHGTAFFGVVLGNYDFAWFSGLGGGPVGAQATFDDYFIEHLTNGRMLAFTSAGQLRLYPSTAATPVFSFGPNIASATGVQAATILNLPAAATAGNPNKWMLIDDNGTPGYIPVWH